MFPYTCWRVPYIYITFFTIQIGCLYITFVNFGGALAFKKKNRKVLLEKTTSSLLSCHLSYQKNLTYDHYLSLMQESVVWVSLLTQNKLSTSLIVVDIKHLLNWCHNKHLYNQNMLNEYWHQCLCLFIFRGNFF